MVAAAVGLFAGRGSAAGVVLKGDKERPSSESSWADELISCFYLDVCEPEPGIGHESLLVFSADKFPLVGGKLDGEGAAVG